MNAARARNPVIPGFHPDPTVCRVGDRFVCATSTFAWCPGIPIHVSSDLVRWQLVGHAVPAAPGLGELMVDDGLYAPGLRHDGERYILACTVVDRRRQRFANFIVTARDPAGPWSTPTLLPADLGRIDPTPFIDEDGRMYLVLNDLPPAPTPEGGNRAIVLHELDRRTFQPIGRRRVLWDGAMKRASTPEAPRIYRRDGWYWLLIAEGGTGVGHAVTMARARALDGPWEPCPSNPLLTHRHLGEREHFQCVGHADLVQAADGSWWALALATRPHGGRALLNRETVLAPVRWDPGAWPVFAPGSGRIRRSCPAPSGGSALAGIAEPWLGLRGPAPIAVGAGELTISASPTPLHAPSGQPGLAARRLVARRGCIAADLGADPGVIPGLALFANETGFIQATIEDGEAVLRVADGGPPREVARGPGGKRLELHWNMTHAEVLADGRPIGGRVPVAPACRGGFTGAVAAITAAGETGVARVAGLAGAGWAEAPAQASPAAGGPAAAV